MTERYIVVLDENAKAVFTDGRGFFTLDGAIEWVKWAEEKMPDNKGKYKIYKLVEVIWR